MHIQLAFDSATPMLSVALKVDNKIYRYHEMAVREQSRKLLGAIEQLLTQAKIKRQQINAVIFGAGPGSFIGTRLAASVAQGLGLALNIPLIAVPTLQTIAQVAYQITQVETIVVAIDARMQEVYWGCYRLQGSVMRCDGVEQLSKPAVIKVSYDKFLRAGNGWSVYAAQFKSSLMQQDVLEDCWPDAAAMFAVAAFQKTLLPEDALPNYVRDDVIQRK